MHVVANHWVGGRLRDAPHRYRVAFREFASGGHSGMADQADMSPARQDLVDRINEIDQQITEANLIGREMGAGVAFRSQVQVSTSH